MTLASTKRIGALALAATVFVAACGGSAATSAPGTGAPGASGAPAAGGSVSGEIFVSGSSTVEPISTGVAEAFAAANPDFKYTVEGPGTGDGFKKFCAGETDISDASRKIKDEEADGVCRRRHRVRRAQGRDRRHVRPDIRQQHGSRLPQPGGPVRARWPRVHGLRQVERRRCASPRSWVPTPSSPTPTSRSRGPARSREPSTASSSSRSRRPPRSATRNPTPAPTTRPRPTTTRSSTASRAATPRSAGSASPSPRRTRTRSSEIQVSKDVNGTCVAPTPETIADGSYPLSRDLYIYVNKAKAAENPAVVSYVDYYLADGTIDSVLQTVPYVGLTADALAETRAAWDAAR